MKNNILYSFRRCPYAMRARLAIAASGIHVELREVVLRNKPPAMLAISPKGTVPVLITQTHDVIDESIDIMRWALEQADPADWQRHLTPRQHEKVNTLVVHNDTEFKYFLDRYKYADRYPEHSQLFYRQQAELTLDNLEQQLARNGFLVSSQPSIADMAIMPFIRQFSLVDTLWFTSSPYPLIVSWLDKMCAYPLFIRIMVKYPQWHQGDPAVYFP